MNHNSLIIKSGWQDSNLRPPAPKAGALTGLRYTPCTSLNLGSDQNAKSHIDTNSNTLCGDGGIRTPDTPFRVCRFSKPVVSATHPRHRIYILRSLGEGGTDLSPPSLSSRTKLG